MIEAGRRGADSGWCAVVFLGLLVGVLGCGDSGGEGDGDAGLSCADGLSCDDGVYCNGVERCAPDDESADANGCVPGTDPCAGGVSCDEETDRCDTGCETPDADGDGYDAIGCGGDDCDDDDPARNPGVTEICDDVDDDCDPDTFGSRDLDGDSYLDAACCNGDACGLDCDDRRRSSNPDTIEICDGIDNDCDGDTDEGVALDGYWDEDLDGSGDADRPRRGCIGELRFSIRPGDCNDAEPHQSHLLPEVCDTVDNDCDGQVDENPRPLPWYLDDDVDGYASPTDDDVTVACDPPSENHVLVPLDCDDTDAGRSPLVAEVCDAIDNNCNGWPDFFVGPFDYEDDDRDGVADAACGGDDCDDTDPSAYPGAVELPDGVDQDCDGTIDEDVGSGSFYADGDGDGFGDPANAMSATSRPEGYVLWAEDCDDDDADRNPDASEACDGVDQDCDGRVDEGKANGTVYYDGDDDGFGTPSGARSVCLLEGDPLPVGFSTEDTDCDDDDPGVYPGAGGCTCPAGTQDNDGNGTCEPACEATTCAPGSCDDSTGTVVCTCAPGYQDNDGDGTCTEDCTTATLSCAAPELCVDRSGTALCGLPQTCADHAAAGETADGSYTLYWGGNLARSWTARCVDLGAGGGTYLALVTGTFQNYSQYTAGGSSPGSNVRTSYQRVRVDPIAGVIDTGDQRFSSSTGSLTHSGSVTVTSMPFATAMTCSATVGQANIDLNNTPFGLVPSDFCTGGSVSMSSDTFGAENRSVDLTVTGNCGWHTARGPGGGCAFNPYNDRGGPRVDLVWLGL